MTFMEAVLDGLRLVLIWPAPGYMLLGVAMGMFFGAVPGLGGMVGMAIILPFTFGACSFSKESQILAMLKSNPLAQRENKQRPANFAVLVFRHPDSKNIACPSLWQINTKVKKIFCNMLF
mgnify:CR=1 FL=1